ncbi:two-component sensor histidine kinase [Sulfurimonas gotlandica GD1]|uniref:histidine kinase n=1 Tax=Sulfurimonas gotlandica (strain DSM 19862 / JCM 16533 / GD1) TaxID=929558 RepID=B6BHX7_SULGG|nr:HAMP domain-containing sensor histidine kinase [Sulfurimonas gotlandica]EDZ63005.1 histidine kinase [Sulfurimonas gotlandica GD1]EHP30129.1 two-component sensor histidine kinase [Sulfurimonas gotlandica GD1]
MNEDENQKLIDEIIVLSKLSNHRLREQTHHLIELYEEQKKKNSKLQKNHSAFLKQVDKRTVVINETSTQKDKMLRQQSKMAAMGEMMDAVAHQWKQPLNSLSMMNDMLKDDFKDGIVDEAYIDDITETAHTQIEHMVTTLNEFRTFFRPSKDSEEFLLEDCINSVEVLMRDELIKNTVNLKTDIKDDIKIYGFINEFKHLFLNLLSNSIDAFNEKNISNRDITIKTYTDEDKSIIEFEDNAQGISNHVISRIFNPHITTKQDSNGTGIGLYMSSQIVKKHNGTISVKNTDSGALFKIIIKH